MTIDSVHWGASPDIVIWSFTTEKIALACPAPGCPTPRWKVKLCGRLGKNIYGSFAYDLVIADGPCEGKLVRTTVYPNLVHVLKGAWKGDGLWKKPSTYTGMTSMCLTLEASWSSNACKLY